MKMLACLLLAIQFVYVLVLKLAAFMASALVILFASLFARELIRNSYWVQPRRTNSSPPGVNINQMFRVLIPVLLAV
jgi:hypothetical protein